MLALSYQISWQLLRPFAGLWLKRRLAAGKENQASCPQRLGRGWPRPRPSGELFWLHAVSAGEAVAACQLAQALLARAPSKDVTGRHILITTNTIAGAGIVARAAENFAIIHAYQPLDHPACVDRFLNWWQPDAAIFLESDYWVNLTGRTARRAIPVFFASAQLSDKSFSRWQKWPALARPLFGAARLILAVDSKQARQFGQLRGLPHDPAVQLSGSLKITDQKLPVNASFAAQLRQSAGNRQVLLAASTHAGEEKLIWQAWQALPDAARPFLIIAPRHPDRAAAILDETEPAGQRSRGELPGPDDRLYLCDSMGEMGSLYAAADLVFLGGTLVPAGGHNPLEPALFGKPILAGPHQFKNQADFDALVASGAVRVCSASQLASQLAQALPDISFRLTAAEAGPAFVRQAAKRPDEAAAAIDAALKAGDN